MKRYSLACAIAVLAICLGSAASAQEMSKQELLATLNTLHHRQAELAQLADDRASRKPVSELAETLQQDHTILNEWLMQAAEGNLDEASTTSLPGEDTYQTLQELEGEDFDTAFLRYQQQLHEQMLELLEQNRPEDSELSSYTNLLKVTHEAMRRHLALIQEER